MKQINKNETLTNDTALFINEDECNKAIKSLGSCSYNNTMKLFTQLNSTELRDLLVKFELYRDDVCGGGSDISVHEFYARYQANPCHIENLITEASKDDQQTVSMKIPVDLVNKVNELIIGKKKCQYPHCLENEDETCESWLTGDCSGPEIAL